MTEIDDLSYEKKLRKLGMFRQEKAPGRFYSGLPIFKGGLQERWVGDSLLGTGFKI